ncbi:MAG: glycosyltransferase family 4 protein [Bacteroidota bacterium]
MVANTTWNLHHFRRGLTAALLAKGFRVVLLAPAGPERKQLEALGATFVPLQHLRRSGMNPFRDLALLWELKSIYKREHVTHALHFTIKPVIYGSLAARVAGVVNVSTLTGLGYTFLSGAFTNRLIRYLYRLSLQQAHRVFFHNPDDLALFVKDRLCVANQAQVVGGSGLRLADFPQVDLAVADANRFLFAGRLLSDKGIREYAAAARLARELKPELHFHIVGAIDHENPAAISPAELEVWVTNGDVIYDGLTTDIRPHIARATCVVLPSYREGCPRVLLEAAAVGRPLIGADVPGVREVVTPENGYLVPRKSVKPLRDAILKVHQSTEAQRQNMARAGRLLVASKFSEAAVVGAYLQAVEAN